ncbi:MAG: CBS domain-containing protein [Thermodesulfovibrionia bacterium]|nr:CBS domain-containing protein [Thermodesulfovibrionia bacterium]MCK5511864.1 CBS domain-containing protein [Thermodesulfovibrionia bacterium]
MIQITAEDVVKDIGEEPLTVSPDTTVFDAVKLMLEKNRNAVLIKKNDQYAGIWTERDVMKNLVLEGFDPKKTTVGEHMSFPIISAPHTDHLLQIIDKFLGHNVRHLLIEKEGKYIGLVYAKDVIRAGLTARTKELKELNQMVSLEFYENWKWKKKYK